MKSIFTTLSVLLFSFSFAEDKAKAPLAEAGTWFFKSACGYSNFAFYGSYRFKQHGFFAGIMYVNPDRPELIFDHPGFIGGYRFHAKSKSAYAGFFYEYNLEFVRTARDEPVNVCSSNSPLDVQGAQRINKTLANTLAAGVKFTFLEWLYVDAGIGVGLRWEKNYTEYLHCNNSNSFYGDNKLRFYGGAVMAKIGAGFVISH